METASIDICKFCWGHVIPNTQFQGGGSRETFWLHIYGTKMDQKWKIFSTKINASQPRQI